MGSELISLAHKQEDSQKKKFWNALIKECTFSDLTCPVEAVAPEGSIHIGTLPENLRCPFIQAMTYRKEGRIAEAELWEEAVSGLAQEHFSKRLSRKRAHSGAIGVLLVSKDWKIYTTHLSHD